IDATTDTRPAARAGSTPAALIPTGKPSAAPAPHNNAPATAQGSDGPNTTNSSPAAASPAVTRSTAGRPPRSSAPPPTRPVSYTHLRAHETDSYLVCRLLLE